MNAHEPEACKLLDFPTREPGRSWELQQLDEQEDGDCLIATVAPDGSREIIGRFNARTGNVLASGEAEGTETPAVLCIGDPSDVTGQLKARQAAGNYLRVCRWDRVAGDQVPPFQPNAKFRTLPQCGCGGYLGTPKFFDSFAEMSAWVFCMFFEQPQPEEQTCCTI